MVNNVNMSNYRRTQQYLNSQINQPQNLTDLKRNANIKAQQIKLAYANGDFDSAATLAYEYQRILQDIDNYYK